MVDFNLIKELSIIEGNVVKIENEIGQVIWQKNVKYDLPIKLGVEKITANTYAGETTYENEQFILLDIYPETADSIISVTYEGLTKTLTFNGTNAKQVYFGTFNGVSDSVLTPSSGIVTIEGQCVGFGCSSYNVSNKSTKFCSCITEVYDFGNISIIKTNAFRGCTNLEITELPISITTIGNYAFYGCTNLALTELPSGLTSIGEYAFYGCTSLMISSLPSGITSIGNHAFNGCTEFSITEIPEGVTSIGEKAFYYVYEDTPNGQMIPFKVEHMRLPSTLQSLGDAAFSINCEHPNNSTPSDQITLKTLTINATTPPSVSDTQFLGLVYYNGTNNVGGITFIIIVPQGCGATYKAATGWSFYANYIVEAS